jgi:hypothetical protein
MQRNTLDLGTIPPPFAHRTTLSTNVDTATVADEEEFLVVHDAASKFKSPTGSPAAATSIKAKISSEQEDDDDKTNKYKSIERVRTGSFFHYDDDQVHPIEWNDFVAALSRDYDERKKPEHEQSMPEIKHAERREDKEDRSSQSCNPAENDVREKEAAPSDRKTKFRRAKERRRKLQERREKGKRKPFGLGLLRFKNKENHDSSANLMTYSRIGYVPVNTPSKEQVEETEARAVSGKKFSSSVDEMQRKETLHQEDLYLPLASPTEDLIDEIEDFLFKSKNSQSIDAMDQDAFSKFITSIQKEILRTEDDHQDDEDQIFTVSDDTVEEEMMRAVHDSDREQATHEPLAGPYDELPENQQCDIPFHTTQEMIKGSIIINNNKQNRTVEHELNAIPRVSTMESFREAIDRIKKVLSEDKEKLPGTAEEHEEDKDDISVADHESQISACIISSGNPAEETAYEISNTVHHDDDAKSQHLKCALERLEKALSGDDTKNSKSVNDLVDEIDETKRSDQRSLRDKIDENNETNNPQNNVDNVYLENGDVDEIQQVDDLELRDQNCGPMDDPQIEGIQYSENILIDEIKSDITESVALSPSHNDGGARTAPNQSKWDEFFCWVSWKKDDNLANKKQLDQNLAQSPKRKLPKSLSKEESVSCAATNCSEEKNDFFPSRSLSSNPSSDNDDDDNDDEEEDDEDEETTLASERYTRDRPLRVLSTSSSLRDEDLLDLVESRCCVY